VEFDISETPISGHNKFIPYHVFPESVYTVGVSLERSRAKVSVGTNPWSQVKPGHNLARICEHYGGGGHAVVAAISFRPDEIGEARRVAREIAETLRGEPGLE
jgi:nanoRNase/pAp phosphatase (c-di-AMP/oligoRNAs hydrolase)